MYIDVSNIIFEDFLNFETILDDSRCSRSEKYEKNMKIKLSETPTPVALFT